MKALLLWPKTPDTFWSFLETGTMFGWKSINPPLGLLTVAALLPHEWELRLIDFNVQNDTDDDWEWTDLVLISGMICQKEEFTHLIRKAKRLGKTVAVGGPFATNVPECAIDAGADFLVLDEGESTIPQFLDALLRGKTGGVFRAIERPDLRQTPSPRFDLLKRERYYYLNVQFSRGCPFGCEFCDVVGLFGHVPRTKSPSQMLLELDAIYQLGFRGGVLVVDDNFVANREASKAFLRALIPWMIERDYPFHFVTEASINLSDDSELMDLMVNAGFVRVLLGIETPDEASLRGTHKVQNTNRSLVDACRRITSAGLGIMAGFILGFDGEKSGAGERILQFVEATAIPTAMLSMLQALPKTPLWTRLKESNRLCEEVADLSQTTLSNFIPTRPLAELVHDYIDTFSQLYEPRRHLKRCFRHHLMINDKASQYQIHPHSSALRALLKLIARQGVLRGTRLTFWYQLLVLFIFRRKNLALYLEDLAAGEHLYKYRFQVQQQLTEQLKRRETLHPEQVVKNFVLA